MAAWLLLGALFLATQFTREINALFGRTSYRLLFIRPIGRPLEWLQKHSGFQVYNPNFWGKAGYTAVLAALMVGSLWYFAHNRAERLIAFGLLGGAAAVVLVANVASKALHSHWLQTFSRDTLETLTSPFPVIFLVPVLILYRNTGSERR